MIEGSRISKLGEIRSRSRSWTTSALPEKISFTARWNVVMLSASYVKFKTRTSVTRASSNGVRLQREELQRLARPSLRSYAGRRPVLLVRGATPLAPGPESTGGHERRRSARGETTFRRRFLAGRIRRDQRDSRGPRRPGRRARSRAPE